MVIRSGQTHSVGVRLMYHASVCLLSFWTIMFATLTNPMSVFQRASSLLLQPSNTNQILHRSHQQTSAIVCIHIWDPHWNDIHIHICSHNGGYAWSTHYLTLHSKCTFTWQTSSVSSSSHCLATRQLLLNGVYLHLSDMYLDCWLFLFFELYFIFGLFPMSLWAGFLSRFLTQDCLSCYLHSLPVKVFKTTSYVWCRGTANTHPVWLWIPRYPRGYALHVLKCSLRFCSPLLFVNSVCLVFTVCTVK